VIGPVRTAFAAPSTARSSAAEGATASLAARGRTSGLLLGAIGLALLYAAFADGATDLPQESWLQLMLLVIAVAATGAWLYGGAVRPAASRAAWIGVGLLTAFAVWTGITILFSVAPDRSWMSLNRAIAYVVVTVLAVAVGASLPRAPERVARALALLVVPVALYALGGKTLPQLRIDGVIDLDHAAGLSRLRSPLGYWNALALLCVIGLFPMLRLAADPARRVSGRLAALGGLYLLVLVLGLTYSRGGILAFLVGGLVFISLTTERVRSVVLLVVSILAAVVPLIVVFTRPDLVANGLPLASRRDDATAVLIAVLVVLAAVLMVGRGVIALERGRLCTPARGRRAGRVVAGLTALLVAVGFAGALGSGAFAAAAERFTDTRNAGSVTDPNRLLSTNSGNRWTWWQEAVGAWSEKPLAGWGAGSFPVTHKRHRTELLPVQQPHSVPLQFLAETGIIGLVLGMGAVLALLAAAVARVRAMPWAVAGAPPGRGYAAALLAAPCAWLARSFYDWDWDIPAVTLPVLLALGVLVARPAEARLRVVLPRSDGGLRGLGFGVGVLALILAMVSAALPALAETRTASALVAVGADRVDDEALAEAAADAELAARLNPLAVEPLIAAASIAQRRDRIPEARMQILRAVERQPENYEAWLQLARIEFVRQDRAGLRRAAGRALELDPLSPQAAALARRAQANAALPEESATATGSPLPQQVPVTTPDPAAAPVPAPTP